MTGIYFSGSGNTKYCVERFLALEGAGGKAYSIEDSQAVSAIMASEEILLAYPIYYSNLPKIMADFLATHQPFFRDKRIFLLTTMGLFSGDGAGCGARLLKRYGAEIIGGLHLRMPDCISDEKVLKRTPEGSRQLVTQAEETLKGAVDALLAGHPPQQGLSPLSHVAGLLGQRLWFSSKTKHYSDRLHIDSTQCVACGKCAALCPMDNLAILDGAAVSGGRCTMCYRCINHCPQKAITLLGKQVVSQWLMEQNTPNP